MTPLTRRAAQAQRASGRAAEAGGRLYHAQWGSRGLEGTARARGRLGRACPQQRPALMPHSHTVSTDQRDSQKGRRRAAPGRTVYTHDRVDRIREMVMSEGGKSGWMYGCLLFSFSASDRLAVAPHERSTISRVAHAHSLLPRADSVRAETVGPACSGCLASSSARRSSRPLISESSNAAASVTSNQVPCGACALLPAPSKSDEAAMPRSSPEAEPVERSPAPRPTFAAGLPASPS